VKQERLARGLAYRDAAARAGVAPATWLRIEHGEVVRDAQLGRVAAAFGWSAEELRRVHSETESNVERLDALEREVADLRRTLQDLVDELRVRRPQLRRRLPPTIGDP
jgi:transcriptional regulator with XRE-family HTH domain